MNLEEYIQKKKLTKDDLGWLWLDAFTFLNANKKNKIRQIVGNGEEVFNIRAYEKEMLELIKADDYLKMLSLLNDCYLQLLVDDISNKVDFISIDHKDYPSSLRDIDCPPIVLYYKGDISLLKTRCIAVAGTRLFDSYGFAVTEKFVKAFVNANLTVVSGLNEGLDTITHKIVLDNRGKTIAVISGGIEKIYPAINSDICKEIAKVGLVISEWPPKTDSLRYMFPIRGRIITGITEAVLITEAGMNSGVRYIVDYALEQNKTIYAIPGNITSYKSSYTNSLIKSCQSMLVTHPDEILEDMEVVFEPFKETEEPNVEEALIYAVLDNIEEAHFDFILIKTGIPQKKLMGILTGLEIKGKIKRMPGNKYIRLK